MKYVLVKIVLINVELLLHVVMEYAVILISAMFASIMNAYMDAKLMSNAVMGCVAPTITFVVETDVVPQDRYALMETVE